MRKEPVRKTIAEWKLISGIEIQNLRNIPARVYSEKLTRREYVSLLNKVYITIRGDRGLEFLGLENK
jgi:hypothetical protein